MNADLDSQVHQPPVVFYDGVCGLCNRWIDFLFRHDRLRRLKFAPLQGTTASQTLPGGARMNPDSVVLWEPAGVYEKSDAVWRILCALPFPWPCCGWAIRLVPRFLRNWGYELIAKRRYRWFGKMESCRLPNSEERAQFLP